MTNQKTPAFDLQKHLGMKKQADRLCDVIALAIHNIKIAKPVDASLLRAPETLDKQTSALILNNAVQLTASSAQALLQAEIDRRERELSDGLRKLQLIKAILADELDGKALSYFANYRGNVKIQVPDEFLRADGETFTLRESASHPPRMIARPREKANSITLSAAAAGRHGERRVVKGAEGKALAPSLDYPLLPCQTSRVTAGVL